MTRRLDCLILAGVSGSSVLAVAIFDASQPASLSNSSVRPTTNRRRSPRTVARDLALRPRLHGSPTTHCTARRGRRRRRMEIDALLPNQSGRQCCRRAPGCLRVHRPCERASERQTEPATRLSRLLPSPFDRLLRQDRGMNFLFKLKKITFN